MSADPHSKHRRLLKVLKWLGFLACVACFAWKSADCLESLFAGEIGTDLELASNINAGMPSFAVCKYD